MSKQIWKYILDSAEVEQEIEMPMDAEILTVQIQGDKTCMWALVNTDLQLRKRIFEVYGTGHSLSHSNQKRKYIGTYQLMEGALVFHLFELLN